MDRKQGRKSVGEKEIEDMSAMRGQELSKECMVRAQEQIVDAYGVCGRQGRF